MVGAERRLYPIPLEMTMVRVPLRMRHDTAMTLRFSLEDQVILGERLQERMTTLIGMVSTSLRQR